MTKIHTPNAEEWPLLKTLSVFLILFVCACVVTCMLHSLPKRPWDEIFASDKSKLINHAEDKVDLNIIAPRNRANAVITILTRDDDLHVLRKTLIQFEDRFNGKYHYPYVFLNDKPFSDSFKKSMLEMLMERNDFGKLHLTRNVSFGVIPVEHWSYPEWIDQVKASEARRQMAKTNVLYAGSESYRHMCRFYSGFFYRHPLLAEYDYFWRVEPGVDFYCDVDYDPFVFMMENGKEYGFTITIDEFVLSIPTLWNTTKKYLKEVYPQYRKDRLKPAESPALKLVMKADNSTIRDKYIGELLSSQDPNEFVFQSPYHSVSWSTCHYWDNFEIAHLSFFRSPLYQSYFDYLDKAGGFFYERWGDAPVHSLAVAMFLESSQVHFFDDIGYQHPGHSLCPSNQNKSRKCYCDPRSSSNIENDKRYKTCIDLWHAGQD